MVRNPQDNIANYLGPYSVSLDPYLWYLLVQLSHHPIAPCLSQGTQCKLCFFAGPNLWSNLIGLSSSLNALYKLTAISFSIVL